MIWVIFLQPGFMQLGWGYPKTVDMCGRLWKVGPEMVFREAEPKKGRNSTNQASNPMETRPKITIEAKNSKWRERGKQGREDYRLKRKA